MGLKEKIQANEKLTRFLKTLKERVTESDISNTSVVVAYYLLLSLFPLLIVVGNMLPLFNIDPNSIFPYLAQAIPKDIYSLLQDPIKNLLTNSSGSLLSVSAIGALWGASKSINALQLAMNRAYGVENRSNPVIVRLVSLGTIFLLLTAMVIVTVFFGMGQIIINFFEAHFSFPFILSKTFSSLKWPVTTVVLFLIMAVIYFIAPNAMVRIRSVFPGAAFTTVGWMILSQGFGLYAKYFSKSVSGYQVIGSFIVLMLWLNFAATIIILGGILNAVLEEFLSGNIEAREKRLAGLRNKKNEEKNNEEQQENKIK